ncbi:uncharacterized protein LTR77_010980 [Saxophila tyrrhenica]|uniref:endo-1,3(4)-beta-glucanase n=1 Tax=Saxophila tyrrhenica TaxID=1690608 RepID=A0AAV9NWJ8_9PEZI|nr:hypothetical protein LTR77_010980 [Saxophila tyrrhenica]
MTPQRHESTQICRGKGFAFASAIADFSLTEDYFAEGDFFDRFTFWDSRDPTHGFVQYQARENAQGWLIDSTATKARMRVDSDSFASQGRASVRITSRSSYQFGLFIVDIEHMPGGICGTWPAFWMVGPDWPTHGEIDIVEGVNTQETNAMTLHTGPGCSTDTGQSAYNGSLALTDCSSWPESNEGCQIAARDTMTYGGRFNDIGGGIYATWWTSTAISVYFFPRHVIPPDVREGSPDPQLWGSPLAQFRGDCDMSTSFRDLQMVFDTTFCGDWAGADWVGGQCASRTGQTCEEYVEQNPNAFTEAYWSIRGLKVYHEVAGVANSSAGTPSQSNAGTGTRVSARRSTGAEITNSSSISLPSSTSAPYSSTVNSSSAFSSSSCH